MEALCQREMSCSQLVDAAVVPELAEETREEAISLLSYHVRKLRDAGLIELVRKVPGRGSDEQIYRGDKAAHEREMSKSPLLLRRLCSTTESRRKGAAMPNQKKIAVAGATGRLGTHVVEVLRERGHEVVPISRLNGVDVVTGEGLGEALDGAQLIVDAATGPSPDEREATEFFTSAAGNLQRAGAERGVEEILAVSIIGIEHFRGGYYAAKVAHERAHLDGPVPVRILRASQFHEFVSELVKWGTQNEVAYVNEMRTQLVAARSVAEALADLADHADSAPLGNPVSEVAGRREESLVEAAKLLVASRGDGLEIEVGENPDDPEHLWTAGALLPGPVAKLGGPTFEEWLRDSGAQA